MRVTHKAEFVCDTRSEGGLIVFEKGLVVDLHSTGKKFARVTFADRRGAAMYRVPKESVRLMGGSENA